MPEMKKLAVAVQKENRSLIPEQWVLTLVVRSGNDRRKLNRICGGWIQKCYDELRNSLWFCSLNLLKSMTFT